MPKDKRQREPASSATAVLSQYVGQNLAQPEEAVKRPRSIKRLIKRALLVCLALVIIFGGWFSWNLYHNLAKATGNSNPFQIFSLFFPAHLNETNGRVNILLAGYSVDDPHHQGAALTDSIMVVSVNPKTKTAVLLSIPRDTWVHIPGFGYQKINAAYEDGQQENFNQAGYDPGGMGLLEEVVQQNFGIQTDYNGLIDYSALRDAVNAVGGVTITINSPDPRGVYDPYTQLKLPNGPVTLNGQQALDLARTRGDGPGAYGFPQADFSRTQYQQKLLIALKEKLKKGNILTNPFKVVSLVNAVGANLKTNMPLNVMSTLYSDTSGMSSDKIQTVTLNNYQGQSLLTGYYAPDGEDALIPAAGFNNWTEVQAAVNQILYGSSY